MSDMTNVFWGRWISLLYRYGLIFVTKELKPYNIGKGQFMFLLALYQRDGVLQDKVIWITGGYGTLGVKDK